MAYTETEDTVIDVTKVAGFLSQAYQEVAPLRRQFELYLQEGWAAKPDSELVGDTQLTKARFQKFLTLLVQFENFMTGLTVTPADYFKDAIDANTALQVMAANNALPPGVLE